MALTTDDERAAFEVTHENPPNRSTPRFRRSIRLDDSTPPFFLSQRLVQMGRGGPIRGVRFFDFLGGPMLELHRAAEISVDISVFGSTRKLVAERYRSEMGDELWLIPTLDEFPDANLIARLCRDDEFVTELISIA